MPNCRSGIVALITLILLITISGCASVRSTPLPQTSKIQGGMVYYLPMQRVKLTLVVVDGTNGAPQVRTVSVLPTTALADHNAGRYVAQYRRNQIGSNTLKIAVSADGLLTGESQGSNTPRVAEFLAQLAATPERMNMRMVKAKGCASAGTYEWVLDITATDHPEPRKCGLEVDIVNFGSLAAMRQANGWKGVNGHGQGHGYFYRQKRPVQVTISSEDGQRKIFLLSIVDEESPTEYLPVPRTLFAEATWKVSFTDGSPTLYDVSAGGDLLGLVKLPADVLKAYSLAVAAGFNDRKGAAVAESEYLKQLAMLATQQAKYEACRAAAQSGDQDKVKEACN